MQVDEEYGNLVWDKHFGNLYSKLELQSFIIKFVDYSTLLSLFNLIWVHWY